MIWVKEEIMDIKEILINTEKKIIGFMFTVPVSQIYTLSNH